MIKLIVATIIGLTLSGNVLALTKGNAIEAYALQSGCQDKIDAKDGYCTMYLNGYIDGIFSGTYLNVPSDFEISTTALRHLFLAHMTSNPEDAKKAAWISLLKTLLENTSVSYKDK